MHVYRHLFEMHFNDTFSPLNHDMDIYPTHKNHPDEEEEEEEENLEQDTTNGASGASSFKRTPVRHITHLELFRYKSHTNSDNTLIQIIS